MGGLGLTHVVFNDGTVKDQAAEVVQANFRGFFGVFIRLLNGKIHICRFVSSNWIRFRSDLSRRKQYRALTECVWTAITLTDFGGSLTCSAVGAV